MNKKYFHLIISLTIFLILWELTGYYIGKEYILPLPTSILKFILVNWKSIFFIHFPATASIMLSSLSIAIVLGILLAFLMDKYTVLENLFYPIIVITQTLPIIAIAPVFILWFGYSIWSKIIVVVLMVFFPITVNVLEGLKSIKREYLELFISLKATEKDKFYKLKVFAVLPYFFSALKIAIPFSLTGATVGEWLGAQKGLGYLSKRMMTQLDGPGIFAPIIILSLFAIISVQIITFIENKYIHWRREL
jgi:putative hydroxymethylpyrimidine transport system permease protein